MKTQPQFVDHPVILAHTQVQVVTADFHYLRLHGHTTLYGGSYEGHHQKWAATISKLLQTPLWGNEGSSRSSIGVKRENKADVQESGTSSDEQQHEEGAAVPSCERDVFVFFDNDQAGHAARDAIKMLQNLRAAAWCRATSTFVRYLCCPSHVTGYQLNLKKSVVFSHVPEVAQITFRYR